MTILSSKQANPVSYETFTPCFKKYNNQVLLCKSSTTAPQKLHANLTVGIQIIFQPLDFDSFGRINTNIYNDVKILVTFAAEILSL